MNSLWWKRRPSEVKHYLEESSTRPARGRVPSAPAQVTPQRDAWHLAGGGSEKVQSCLFCNASDKEIASKTLLN